MKKHKVDHKLMKSIKDAHKEKHHAHKKHESKKHEKHESKKHEKHEDAAVKKAMHHPDKLGAGAKKRKKLPPKKKVEVVMKEFKRGTLNSGSGAKVTNPKQAIAIGLSEARKAGAKIPKKKKK
jgi:Family of unknown function (DUF6496)